MARIRADLVLGVTETALTETGYIMTSEALKYLPAVTSGNVAAITLHGDPATREYEIVHVADHAQGATTAQILRGQEGSTRRAWGIDTPWTHGPTATDLAGTMQGDWQAGTYPANSLVRHDGRLWVATSTTDLPPLVRTQLPQFDDPAVWSIRNAYSTYWDMVFLTAANQAARNAAMTSQQTWTPDWKTGLSFTVDAMLSGTNDELYLGFIDASLPHPPPGEVDQVGPGYYTVAINIATSYIYAQFGMLNQSSEWVASKSHNYGADPWTVRLFDAGKDAWNAFPCMEVYRYGQLVAFLPPPNHGAGTYVQMPPTVRVVVGARTTTTAGGNFAIYNAPEVSRHSGAWRSLS